MDCERNGSTWCSCFAVGNTDGKTTASMRQTLTEAFHFSIVGLLRRNPPMPHYVTLVRYTQQGISKIKDSASRLDAAKKATETESGRILAWYLTRFPGAWQSRVRKLPRLCPPRWSDFQPPKSRVDFVHLSGLPHRHQLPHTLRHGCLVPENIGVLIIRAELEEHMLRAIPLVKHLLDQVFVSLKAKPHRPLVSHAPGIALHFDLHAHAAASLLRRSYNLHRTERVACHGLGDATEKEASQPSAPMGAHDNQVSLPFSRDIQNDVSRVADNH